MDGWWNSEPIPDGAQEPANPFARVPAPDHVPTAGQPSIPAAQPVQPPEALYGEQPSAPLFSQIRQGDPYGYAAPEAVPAPAFSGDIQNPFGSAIGAVPFGSDPSDPMGSSFAGFSADMPYPAMGSTFTPPSYAGFPPLMGDTAAMQPVDAPWQSMGNTAPMPPVEPAPWQNAGDTAPMPPMEPAPWQTAGDTAPLQPVDPALWQSMGNTAPMPTLRWDPATDPAQWQPAADPASLGAQTQRWQPDAPQPWEAPLTNVHTEQTSFLDDPALSLPEYPEASPDWTPPEGEAPITPEFMKDWAEKEKAADPADRLNIPVYLRNKPLPAKRPVKKRKPVQEAELPLLAGMPSEEPAMPADPEGETLTPAGEDPAAEAILPAEDAPAGEAEADPAGDTEAAPEADAGLDADTKTPEAAEAADGSSEPETEAGEENAPEAEADTAAEETEPAPREESDETAEPAGEAAPEATAPEAEPAAAENPNARFMRPAVTLPLCSEPAAETPAPQPEAAPKRRTRMERHAVLQPAALDADALKPRRRSQHAPTDTPPAAEPPAGEESSEEAGYNRPFVPAAVAEDSRAEALPARPQSQAVTPAAAVAAPGNAKPNNGYGDWPSLSDPDFAADDSYRYLQLFGQQPLYGDMMKRTAAQPLPGPAPDDPGVPWVDAPPAAPAPLPTDKAIREAAMEDTARDKAADAAANPYAAAFAASDAPVFVPAADDEDFLMDEQAFYEEPDDSAGSFRAGAAHGADREEPEAEPPRPFPGTAADPLPPAADGEEPLLPEADPIWEDDLIPPAPEATSAAFSAAGPPADPIPDFPPLGTPYGSVTGQPGESAAIPDGLREPLSEPAPGSDTGAYGTSSYDAGDMPNPTRGHMPYEVVSAFDTDSRQRAELLAAQAAAVPQPQPPAPPQPAPVKPPKQPKPEKPPIKPFRVLLLLAAAAMVVYIAVTGSRLITAYVQNTEEWAAFYNRFHADNGVDVNHAGETLQLRSDGSTFPPVPGSASAPAATPPPSVITAQTGTEPENTGRTRQLRYADNELRNIREEMVEIREEYPEVMGRLEIPGVVDEWVVQRNNTYYLNHNYRGTAEEGGAVFMDSANTLFTPPENLHLRGSDSAPGKTFHPLWQYKTGGAAFVTGAAQATVTTLYEKADYLLVAVFEASMDPARPDYFNYSSYPTFASDAEMMDYIAKVRQRSLYALPTDVMPGDRLLTLSTVSSAPGADEKPVCLVLIFRHRPAAIY